jgi:hypothetical protein
MAHAASLTGAAVPSSEQTIVLADVAREEVRAKCFSKSWLSHFESRPHP